MRAKPKPKIVMVFNPGQATPMLVEVPPGYIYTLGPGGRMNGTPFMFRIYRDKTKKDCVYAMPATGFREADLKVLSRREVEEVIKERRAASIRREMVDAVEQLREQLDENEAAKKRSRGHAIVGTMDDAEAQF